MTGEVVSSCSPPPDGLTVLTPNVHRDDRGLFFERFNHRRFHEVTGADVEFVQDNQSQTVQGGLRGLHYQLPPSAQGKLMSCVSGAIFDVAVDIRRSSRTYSEWLGVVLSEQNRTQLWIPAGFAHGFVSLSDGAEVIYKATAYYDPATERSIRWDDPDIGIEWQGSSGGPPLVSEKDRNAPFLKDAETFQ